MQVLFLGQVWVDKSERVTALSLDRKVVSRQTILMTDMFCFFGLDLVDLKHQKVKSFTDEFCIYSLVCRSMTPRVKSCM